MSEEKSSMKNKEYTITINGRDYKWNEKRISFNQVLGLIGVSESTTVYYIITYSKGIDEEPKGEITKTKDVKVKDGMIINAKPNNKS
ncbi:multiubiquitin domain-containing protein [Flagellimonas lutimaris]|uniref:multiubiquitin domain-containing protein n=1 Tax=Flagellimonas lutimaris TaxID=475082 RepID=UPI003F5CF15F